jgi:uncharacterized protein YceK
MLKRRTLRVVGLLIAPLGLAGCGTINSYANGCPAPYSGVSTDRAYLRTVSSFGSDALRWAMLTSDLPLSLVVDTVTLPIAIWAERPPPAPVSPGCLWAISPR